MSRWRVRVLFTVCVVTGAFAVSDPRAAASSPPPPDELSSISVDFDRIVRVVPPLLFGQNLQVVDRGDGLVKPNGAFDEALVELLQEARITNLRYPGGTAADYFHWWQMLGPHSGRVRQVTGFGAFFNREGTYDPVLGPDEFIRLSTALKAIPFVTANSLTGSPLEAGEFAKFFVSRGFPVTYWEIGNEVYFNGINGLGAAGPPPEVYARKVVEFATAIRKELPSAKIYASFNVGPGQEGSFWDSVVLRLAGPYIDGVSVHNAYYPLFGALPDETAASDEYLYRAMLGATKEVDRSMGALEAEMDRLGKLLPIFLTEYDGAFYPFLTGTQEDPARTLARNPTLAAALFNASVLSISARHPRVVGAHHMSLAGSDWGSLVGREGNVLFRNPQFLVHREYAKEAGRLLVESTLAPETAVFNSGATVLLPAQTDVPMLEVMATRDPGSQSFALFVVNRSLTTGVVAPVTLTLPPGVRGTVSLMTGPNYDSKNSAEDQEQVKMTTVDFASVESFPYRFPPYSLTVFRWTR